MVVVLVPLSLAIANDEFYSGGGGSGGGSGGDSGDSGGRDGGVGNGRGDDSDEQRR